MSLIVKGIIQQILKAESGVSRAGNEWKKQEFVLETSGQYPKKICFTIFNEKFSLLEKLSEGDEVEVTFNLESREYNGKWFHNINAWKVDKTAAGDSVKDAPPEYRLEDIPPEPDELDGDELPF